MPLASPLHPARAAQTPTREPASIGVPMMNHEAKHDLREDALDAAVVAAILLVITSVAVAAVRFALS